ncbi:LOW QUALITY PROTEIN: uncharacterized protein LOC108052991 [Drosophila rhopaloa]|uniref:Uncharacterized protein n=1 Tax=Drosophila rhopaloa TaxID=1041015 RepID=A0ABM5I6T6_DRORH|nr:LOW QUALITY PROTEIN: uncharacterized protein LOC108052991 [Drosophila rhopaloa]
MSRYLLTISCFLLIRISVPISSTSVEVQKLNMPFKEAATWSRMLDDMGQSHVHRLYNAYRDRLRGEGDDVEGEVKISAMELKDVARKSTEPKALERAALEIPIFSDDWPVSREKPIEPIAKEKDPPIIKYDATDDQPHPSGKCLARLPIQSRANQSDIVKPKAKAPLVSSVIILKMDVPEKMLRVKPPEKMKDPGERRIFELNRIYNEFLKAWQQPVQSLPAKTETPNKVTSSLGSQRLSALFELMDVVERLQKSDLVKELAQKINEEMEPNLQNQIKQDALLVTESRASLRAIKKNDLSGIFENVEPGSASIAFKRMLDDINSRRSTIKAGGLYDEYKKGFCELFSNQKFPRESLITSEADYPLDSETSRKNNDNFPCRCDNSKPTPLRTNQPEDKTQSKVSAPVANAKPKMKYLKALETYVKMNKETNQNGGVVTVENPRTNINYLKALETFLKMNKESNENGGLKPYYLPNSKNRQLVWNDIPLIKPGLSESPKKTLESKPKYKPSSTPIKENVVPEKESKKEQNFKTIPKQETKGVHQCTPKTETKLEQGFSKAESKGEQCIPKSENKLEHGSPKSETKLDQGIPKTETKAHSINPWQDVFSGLDPKQIISGLKAIKQSSFFNLADEYQKQIDNLNQALKTKQSWWKEVVERGKAPVRTPMKRNVLMNNAPTGSAMPVPYPEVLVNQAPQMNCHNVIDNMASQMNLSPLEMAQRIVGTSQNTAFNSGAGRVGFVQTNIQPASQIGSGSKKGQGFMCQVPCQPMGQQPQPQQQQDSPEQTEQTGISPVLDKILQRLENIQATKCNQTTEEVSEKELPCCFVDPADGAPCDLNGSWESLVLGVRINIRSNSTTTDQGEEKPKPTCSQHKASRARRRFLRQCVKMNKTQLKEIAEVNSPKQRGVSLNISVQDTVPPRAHDLLENLTDWSFSGHASMILGGPISISFRKENSNLIGHFVGYCRTCGCVDTIFGSWTFCQPSRDCQDICMSIVDRRDMLRRYSMDERRKNRFKEQLYIGSKFAKMEKERLRAEQEKYEKLRYQIQGETDANTPSPKSQGGSKS